MSQSADTNQPGQTGFAPVNGLDMYWELHGSGDVAGGTTPVIVVHGGYGVASMLRGLVERLAGRRDVVAIELQGHGHTGDIDRPFSYEAFGDDIAALIDHLDLERADLIGYSLGAGACLQAAVRRPDKVRKLAVVSFPFRRDGWYPEILAAFDQMGSAGFEYMRHSPMYTAYAQVAPDPDAFPALMDKIGALQRRPYDWSEEVRTLAPETMLVFGDADSIPANHAAEFFALLGGGLGDAGWEGAARPTHRLAIIPGTTHYDMFGADLLANVLDQFIG